MIPKIIHYVWVGDAPKPDLVQKCIASWKECCPDYQIMEWGNDALKYVDCAYVREAVQCKKWAFVSDCLRLYALNKFGGIYCDADLELTRPLDEFLKHDFFMGLEKFAKDYNPMTAIIGAVPGNPIVSDLLGAYNHRRFLIDGEMDLTTNVATIGRYLKQRFPFFNPEENKVTRLTGNMVIYPVHYFCNSEDGQNNYAIHHYAGSWLGDYLRKKKFSIGRYAVVSIKKVRPNPTEPIPIKKDEKILLKFQRDKRRTLFVLERN